MKMSFMEVKELNSKHLTSKDKITSGKGLLPDKGCWEPPHLFHHTLVASYCREEIELTILKRVY